ncbi:MAG TPA: cupredoxin domain-containing protein [Gaiellaceae bacterium]|jgi:uncharacterized cupredoxin-like copper-binding protein
MVRYRIGLLSLVATCAVLAWALPAGARTTTTHVSAVTHLSAVTVTAGKPSEFRFTLSKKKVPIGTVTFHVLNKGTVPHDFKINGHKTRLLSPGQSQTLKVTFKKKGSYPYLCTVTGHAIAGMKGIFKVT